MDTRDERRVREKRSTPQPHRIPTSKRCHHRPDMRRHDIVCRYTCPTPPTRIDHRPKLLVSRQRPAPSSTSEVRPHRRRLEDIGPGQTSQRPLVNETSLPSEDITTTSPQSTHPNIAPTSPESNCGGRGGDTYRATAYRTSHSSRRQPPANRPWPQTSRIHSQLVCGIWKVRGTDSVVWGWGS